MFVFFTLDIYENNVNSALFSLRASLFPDNNNATGKVLCQSFSLHFRSGKKPSHSARKTI